MTTLVLPAKSAVRRSFDAAATTYDEHAFLQREIGDRLLERLDYIKQTPARILDIGCGTGYVTRKMRERYADSQIIGIDLAPQMARTAAKHMPQSPALARLFRWGSPFGDGRSPSNSFICADAEALPFQAESIDFAISNLTLQWCDPERVAKEVMRVLRPNGLFMFTTFGPDTLKELRTAFRAVDEAPHVNEFIDMHDIGDVLSHSGFADPVMDQETITLTYAELKAMLRELKGIGAHNILPGRANGLMGKSQWMRLVTAYEKFRHEGRLPATYEVVYGHAWKPEFSKRKTVDGLQAIDLNEFKRMVKKPST
jgi:malonyl-CoA O-methyltransferase